MRGDAIIGAVEAVTKKWAKQRKAEERQSSAALNRRYVMTRSYHTSIKDAAWNTMEDAYLKASANNTLPAHARQIMYAARPYIQRHADREMGKSFDKYFTQTLLPDYMEDYPEKTAGWNVVFDARGNFREPHTGTKVPLGTLQVRDHLQSIVRHTVDDLEFNIMEGNYPTSGPNNRYGAILFIEKEGFMPLLDHVDLWNRYDIAPMSTKGMSVTASRALVDTICGRYNIPLLVLHDFDKSGFSIAGTLQRDTRRYTFDNKIEVIDLGLRLGDIDGLETEYVHIQSPWKARENLEENGATEDEIEFLLEQRVELNAFASDDLVAFIEGKLDDLGVAKVIPDTDTLADAYRRTTRQAQIQAKIDALIDELDETVVDVPDDLADQVAEQLKKTTALSWDDALIDIAKDDAASSDG